MDLPPPPRRRLKVIRLISLLGVVVVLGGGLFLLHRTQVKAQAGSLLERARGAVAAGDWDAAADLYRRYIALRRGDTEAVAEFANALEKTLKDHPGNLRSVVDTYERLLVLDPFRLGERRTLAKIYLNAGGYANARTHLRFLQTPGEGNQGHDPDILEMLAVCLIAEHKIDEAVKTLDQAVLTGKATPDAYYQLALLLKNEVKTPEAAERADDLMNQLVTTRPDDIRARLARAQYRLLSGNPKGAREDLDFAVHRPGGDKDPDVLLAFARLALFDNKLDEAEDVLVKGKDAAPTDNRFLLLLDEVRTRKGDNLGAIRTLTELAARLPAADLPLLEVLDRLIDRGDQILPAERAAKYAAEERTKPIADYLLGRVRLLEGNWPDALDRLQRAAASPIVQGLPAYHLKTLLGIGQCYAAADNPDRQLTAYAAAAKAGPGSVQARLGQAEALARLGRLRDAIDAYQGLVAQIPGARAPLCRLKLAEILSRPSADRNWAGLDEAFGPPPLAADVAVVRANALAARGRVPEAEAALTEAVDRAREDGRPRVALAALKATTDPAAGLAVLDQATKDIGDQIEFRLTRAQILARQPGADPNRIKELANKADASAAPDKYRLNAGVGEILAALGRRDDATDLYTKAADALRYDLLSRATLFDLALADKRTDLQDRMLAEIGRLEGPDGPVGLAAEVTRGVIGVKVPPGSVLANPADTKPLRDKLAVALDKRPSWGRLYMLAGDLDRLDGRPDSALENYRKALDRGEQTDTLVRQVVRLLLDRQYHAEALQLLARLDREVALGPDLAKQLTMLRSMFGEDPTKNLSWVRSPASADSKDYRDQLYRATVFALNNAPDEAKGALDRAVGLNDTAPEVWVALVRFLAATGQRDEAGAAVRQATARLGAAAKTTGGDPGITALALGACLELLGDLPGAEKYYRESVAANLRDPAGLKQLFLVLQQTGRRAEAEKLLSDRVAAADTAPAVRRWARRMLAFSVAGGPDGYPHIPAALDLIHKNLDEGGNLLDDQRAEALVLALDPFRRTEAIDKLARSAARSPLAADESFLLAKLYLQNSQLEKAEDALRGATRAAALSDPEHLGLLVKVLLIRGNVEGAKEAVGRLKLVAPNHWETTAAEARLLAKQGKRADAGKRVLAAPPKDDAGHLLTKVGPLLEEIGAADAAEQAYKRFAELSKPPDAHRPLATFYLRQGRGPEAVGLARRNEAGPPGLTARLLSGAVRCCSVKTLPEADQATWPRTVKDVEAWVADRLRSDPTNPDLLYAQAELDDAAERYPQEIAAYERALAANPTDERFLNNLAVLLAVTGDKSPRPLELIDKAISLKGARPYLLDSRAVINLLADRVSKAEEDLDTAIALDPRPVFYFHLAQAYDRGQKLQSRNSALAEARQRGLTRIMLHPKEWDEYLRLVPDGK